MVLEDAFSSVGTKRTPSIYCFKNSTSLLQMRNPDLKFQNKWHRKYFFPNEINTLVPTRCIPAIMYSNECPV